MSTNTDTIVRNTEAVWGAEEALDQAYSAAYEKYPELKAIEDAEKALDIAKREAAAAAPEGQPGYEDYFEALDKVAELHPEWIDKIYIARERMELMQKKYADYLEKIEQATQGDDTVVQSSSN